jgi:hypothetical protein
VSAERDSLMALVLKQLVAVIDKRTTVICLSAAGQIKPVTQPYETINGEFDTPPFHVHCRSISVPWMPGFVGDIRAQSNAELLTRTARERARADGRVKTGIPGPDVSSTKPAVSPATRLSQIVALSKKDAVRNRSSFALRGSVEASIAKLTAQWTGAHNTISAVREQIQRGEWADVIAAVRSGTVADELWRGLSSTEPTFEAFALKARAGDTISLEGLSSWTESEQQASGWAKGWTSIVLKMVGGTGLRVAGISNTPDEKEWLVTGSAVVKRVVSRETTNGVTRVVLEVEWRA